MEIKENIEVCCIHYNLEINACRREYNRDEITCTYMFGILANRGERCYNFTIDWVKFIVYHKHLIEVKDNE